MRHAIANAGKDFTQFVINFFTVDRLVETTCARGAESPTPYRKTYRRSNTLLRFLLRGGGDSLTTVIAYMPSEIWLTYRRRESNEHEMLEARP
jgi:hypothetical protein